MGNMNFEDEAEKEREDSVHRHINALFLDFVKKISMREHLSEEDVNRLTEKGVIMDDQKNIILAADRLEMDGENFELFNGYECLYSGKIVCDNMWLPTGTKFILTLPNLYLLIKQKGAK